MYCTNCLSDELYGDFEDLETGEVHHGNGEPTEKPSGDDSSDDDQDSNEDEVPKTTKSKEETERSDREKRLEQKRKLKQAFDLDYDGKGDGDYFDDLKAQMADQAQVEYQTTPNTCVE